MTSRSGLRISWNNNETTMLHNTYINLFRDIATWHHEIRHNALIGAGPERRMSFFRRESEEEMQAALVSGVHWPALMVAREFGRLNQDRGTVDDLMVGGFEIRKHVEEQNDLDAREDAKDDCKRIGLEIIAWMDNESEEKGNCGDIEGFDLDSVRYDFTDLSGFGEVGCRFAFAFRDEAFDTRNIDFENLFPGQP